MFTNLFLTVLNLDIKSGILTVVIIIALIVMIFLLIPYISSKNNS